jgi:SprT-like family
MAKIALLHEMIHLKLYIENGDPGEDHGPRFRSELTRLMKEGAYDRLL